MALVPRPKAVELTGLSKNTLRKYADHGTIISVRTPSGNRLFDTQSLLSLGKWQSKQPATGDTPWLSDSAKPTLREQLALVSPN